MYELVEHALLDRARVYGRRGLRPLWTGRGSIRETVARCFAGDWRRLLPGEENVFNARSRGYVAAVTHEAMWDIEERAAKNAYMPLVELYEQGFPIVGVATHVPESLEQLPQWASEETMFICVDEELTPQPEWMTERKRVQS